MVGKIPPLPIPRSERIAYAYATLVDGESRLILNQSTLATDELVKLGRVLVESQHVSHLAYVVLQRLVTPASRTPVERKRLSSLFKRAADEIENDHKSPEEQQARAYYIKEMGDVVRGAKTSLNFFTHLVNESPEVLKEFATVESLEWKFPGPRGPSQPSRAVRPPVKRETRPTGTQPRRRPAPRAP